MKHIKEQRGLGAIAWLIILALFAFFIMMVIKIAPIYVNHYKAVQSLNMLPEDKFSGSGNSAELTEKVWDKLERRFDIDDIEDITKEDFIVKMKKHEMSVTMSYEVRVNLIANIDGVVSFSDTVLVPVND